MSTLLPFFTFIGGLAALTIIIWLPYIWPIIGYHLRRSEGPWLRNFDPSRLSLVITRDILYTISIWFGFLLIRLFVNTPNFWIIFTIGMVSMFSFAIIADKLDKYSKSTPAITLYSSTALSSRTLRDFFGSIGALIPGKQQPYIARTSYSNGFVWVSDVSKIYQKAQQHSSRHKNEAWIQMEDTRTKVHIHLGADIQTVLFISILKGRDVTTGERAALDLINTFATRYPCAVEDAYGNILSAKDLYEAADNQQLILGFQKHIEEEQRIKASKPSR